MYVHLARGTTEDSSVVRTDSITHTRKYEILPSVAEGQCWDRF